MLNVTDFTPLACRASNLAERLIILKQLTEFQGSLPLNSLDIQTVNQEVEALFPSLGGLSAKQQGSFYRLKRQNIKRSLRQYRWVEKNLGELSAQQQQVFAQVHAPWLPIYQQAIAQIIPTCYTPNVLGWGDPTVQGCLPFLKLIETEVTAISEAVELEGIDVSIHPRIVASVQQCFWQQVQIMVNQAVESAPLAITMGFQKDPHCAMTFHAFYLHFPVLARWLAQISSDLIDVIRKAIARLLQDRSEISDQFWGGAEITSIVNCRFAQSAEVALEQPTIQVEFGLANGQTKHLSYYPFSLKAEVGLQQLYAVLSNPQTNIPLFSIVSKQGYGYIAYPQQPSAQNTLEKFQSMGRYLAIRQLLGHHRGLWGKLQIGVAQEELSLEEAKPTPEMVNVQEAIQQGFEHLDQWLRTEPHQATHALILYFSGATARLCHRPTDMYLQLLKRVQSASYLSNPLAVDAVFRTLMERPCPWDSLGELAQLEVKMLWQFKVLWLTVPMNHRYLLYEAEHALFTKLPLSPLEYLARRLQHIGLHRFSSKSSHLNKNTENKVPKGLSPIQSLRDLANQ